MWTLCGLWKKGIGDGSSSFLYEGMEERNLYEEKKNMQEGV
jgi:hypothetical protein